MAATINTNIASINAQRNLALSGQSLNTTMQRLSSGLRVNSAKDDAAGLAIAERMNTQVKGLTVAARNANDGISLAQTAEGALGKVGDMLQRMRELAVQASNATNSDSDRAALQAEVSQLAAEIDRVAKQTNFNGQKILDGSFAGAVFQVGANSGDNVTLGALADTRASKISTITYAVNEATVDTNDTPTAKIRDFNKVIEAGQLKIKVGEFDIELEKIEPANSSLERIGQVITAINNKTADTGVTAYMTLKEGTQEYTIEFMSEKLDENSQPVEINFLGFSQETTGIGSPMPSDEILAEVAAKLPTTAYGTGTGEIDIAGASDASKKAKADFETAYKAILEEYPSLKQEKDVKDKLKAYEETAATKGTSAAATDLRAAIKTALGAPAASPTGKTLTEITAAQKAFDASDKGVDATKAFVTAINDYVGVTGTGDAISGIPHDDAVDANNLVATLAGIQNWTTSAGLNDGLDINETSTAEFKLDQRGINDIDVTTQAGAWIALKKIDSAIDQINGARATLGAMQTRFENAVNNIDIQVENLSAARGRIVDADFAVETANLSRTQILQQAGTAMVAQANQIPQNVLQLLQG